MALVGDFGCHGNMILITDNPIIYISQSGDAIVLTRNTKRKCNNQLNRYETEQDYRPSPKCHKFIENKLQQRGRINIQLE